MKMNRSCFANGQDEAMWWWRGVLVDVIKMDNDKCLSVIMFDCNCNGLIPNVAQETMMVMMMADGKGDFV